MVAIHETRSGFGIAVGSVAHSRFDVIVVLSSAVPKPHAWTCRGCWTTACVFVVTTSPEGHRAFADHARSCTTRHLLTMELVGGQGSKYDADEERVCVRPPPAKRSRERSRFLGQARLGILAKKKDLLGD